MKQYNLLLLILILIGCKKPSVEEQKTDEINYLCISNQVHQFGVKINNQIYCSTFIELQPKINTNKEFEALYRIGNGTSSPPDGSIYFNTLGFQKLGKSPLKILFFQTPDAKIRFEGNINDKTTQGTMNITKISGGLVCGEFECDLLINGSIYKLNGNFKDIPVANI